MLRAVSNEFLEISSPWELVTPTMSAEGPVTVQRPFVIAPWIMGSSSGIRMEADDPPKKANVTVAAFACAPKATATNAMPTLRKRLSFMRTPKVETWRSPRHAPYELFGNLGCKHRLKRCQQAFVGCAGFLLWE